MRPNRRTFVIVALAIMGGLLLWTVRYLESTGSIEIVTAEFGVSLARPWIGRC